MPTITPCPDISTCPIQKAMNAIGGKWKIVILWYLKDSTLRTSELKKYIPQISQKMLIQQLRELQRDGIVHRKVYPQVPPKVEYSLTPKGLTLIPIIDLIKQFGEEM